MSDSDYEFSALMELESDIVNEDLDPEDFDRFDNDQHYCESHPSYYCDSLFCEKNEFNFKCPFKHGV